MSNKVNQLITIEYLEKIIDNLNELKGFDYKYFNGTGLKDMNKVIRHIETTIEIVKEYEVE